MRRHGPFEPHRVPHEQMGKTAFPPLLERLESRFVTLDPDEKPARGRPLRRRAASENDD